MNRTRQFVALFVGGIGTAAALLGAPSAAADEYGGGGADNPLVPGCQVDDGTSGLVTDGESRVCAAPDSSELRYSPNDLGAVGALVDSGGGGFGFGY